MQLVLAYSKTILFIVKNEYSYKIDTISIYSIGYQFAFEFTTQFQQTLS